MATRRLNQVGNLPCNPVGSHQSVQHLSLLGSRRASPQDNPQANHLASPVVSRQVSRQDSLQDSLLLFVMQVPALW